MKQVPAVRAALERRAVGRPAVPELVAQATLAAPRRRPEEPAGAARRATRTSLGRTPARPVRTLARPRRSRGRTSDGPVRLSQPNDQEHRPFRHGGEE
jgi:hypothetical protein